MMEADNELRLLPEERLPIRHEKIHLGQLPKNEDLDSPEPESDFISWVRSVGQLTSITVGQKNDGSYHVHNGRRRIKTMRLLAREWEKRRQSDEGVPEADNPFEYVSADVVDDEHYLAHEALTLMLQQQKPNPIAEIESIERLIQKGHSPTQIARQLKMPKSSIEKKMKLMNLVPRLREALYEGRMAIGPAEKASTLPEPAQHRVAKLLDEKKYITGKDIDEQKQARAQAAASSESLQGLSSLPDIDSLPDSPEQDSSPSQGNLGQSQEVLQAVSYLNNRLDAVRKTSSRARPRWSAQDVEMLHKLLVELS